MDLPSPKSMYQAPLCGELASLVQAVFSLGGGERDMVMVSDSVAY